jgi:hypothetical protein
VLEAQQSAAAAWSPEVEADAKVFSACVDETKGRFIATGRKVPRPGDYLRVHNIQLTHRHYVQEADCMRRAALLDCFDSMQAACGKAWAQLSTEIAIEVCSVLGTSGHPVLWSTLGLPVPTPCKACWWTASRAAAGTSERHHTQ